MTSYASTMPSSPGFVPHYSRYNRSYNEVDQDEQKQQQLSSVHEENLRLKANLTRVQNEYEELRDESNYQRAKVSELSDIVTMQQISSTSPPSPPSSFPSFSSANYNYNSNYNSNSNSNECGESTVHNSLIAKSLENAELTLTVDTLKIELRNSELKLGELQLQKRANNKLLLEMGDVVRTLNSVHIEYDSSSPSSSTGKNNEHLTAQQTSIKNIKLKVEAIMKDRELLVRRCRELEEETYDQQQKVKALEAQFHVVNTTNISKGVALGDAATHTTTDSRSAAPNSPYSTCYSVSTKYSAASNLTPVMMPEDDTMYSGNNSNNNNNNNHYYSPRSVTNASEFVRQSKEIAIQKQREEEHEKELVALKKSKQTQKDTIRRLKDQSERTSKQMASLKEELNNTNEEKEDAVIKRDEFKENLRDIILHYKELNVEHDASKEQMDALQSYVNKLESELQETKEQQEQQQQQQQKELEEKEQQEQQKKEQEEITEPLVVEEENETNVSAAMATATPPSTSSSDVTSCEMEDLIVAYSRATKKIESLETRLEYAGRAALSEHGKRDLGDRHYRDAINRYKKMEKERNEFQRKLDRALEETRLAKIEAQKEREESKHVRRRLTAYLQKKEDDEIFSGYSKPSPQKLSYTPLSVAELMKKDFTDFA